MENGPSTSRGVSSVSIPLLDESERRAHLEEEGNQTRSQLRAILDPTSYVLRNSSRGFLNDHAALVREFTAQEVEERQNDWAYSRPVVILDITWNLAFVAAVISMLILSKDERPSVPLRVWIVGYGLQCLMHIGCVWFEYQNRRMRNMILFIRRRRQIYNDFFLNSENQPTTNDRERIHDVENGGAARNSGAVQLAGVSEINFVQRMRTDDDYADDGEGNAQEPHTENNSLIQNSSGILNSNTDETSLENPLSNQRLEISAGNEQEQDSPIIGRASTSTSNSSAVDNSIGTTDNPTTDCPITEKPDVHGVVDGDALHGERIPRNEIESIESQNGNVQSVASDATYGTDETPYNPSSRSPDFHSDAQENQVVFDVGQPENGQTNRNHALGHASNDHLPPRRVIGAVTFTDQDFDSDGEHSNDSSSSSSSASSVTDLPFQRVAATHSALKQVESVNSILSFTWWLCGFCWIFSSLPNIFVEAPLLAWSCVVFLSFDVIFVLFCSALALIIGVAICCCLPLILSMLSPDEEDEVDEERKERIKNLPKYRFRHYKEKKFRWIRSNNEDGNSEFLGYMRLINNKGEKIEKQLVEEDAHCCICLGVYKHSSLIKELPCHHHFHENCIDKWLLLRPTCPLCKQSIMMDTVILPAATVPNDSDNDSHNQNNVCENVGIVNGDEEHGGESSRPASNTENTHAEEEDSEDTFVGETNDGDHSFSFFRQHLESTFQSIMQVHDRNARLNWPDNSRDHHRQLLAVENQSSSSNGAELLQRDEVNEDEDTLR